ncbi:MAG: DUF962 domain-containing protein [Planctomycetaceae bacterium]|nr:MAG: DUF962 domain-containing protein [Planctomycetaceae bacterium]
MLKRMYDNWYSRHHNRTSYILHMFGIPACFVAAPIALILQQWWLGVGLFVGGYALQFIGHWIEGNQSGEEMLVRRILGSKGKPDKKDTKP